MGNAWERVPEPEPEGPSVEGQDPSRRDGAGGWGAGVAHLGDLSAVRNQKSR